MNGLSRVIESYSGKIDANGKTVFFIPDVHAPDFDHAAINIIGHALEIVKPNIVVIMGDVGEYEGASGWQWKNKSRPPLEFQLPMINQDIFDVNRFLDGLDLIFAKIGVEEVIFLQGNHEVWLDNVVVHDPVLEELAYLAYDALKIDKRGYKWYNYGDYCQIGDHLTYHGGHFSNIHHTKTHAEKVGWNMVYAHTHDHKVWSQPTFDDMIKVQSLGFLGEMNKPFMKGRPHSWVHMFGIGHFDSDGLGVVDPVQIKNGIARVDGIIVSGKRGISEWISKY